MGPPGKGIHNQNNGGSKMIDKIKEVVDYLLGNSYEFVTRTVGTQRTSGVIYVPKKFIGKKAIVLLEGKDGPD